MSCNDYDYNEHNEYDLLIVGGGPCGLSAAITAASDGLRVALVDSKNGFGGQAKASSRIENYPGFLEGISGLELTGKFTAQAANFGVEMIGGQRVTGFRTNDQGGLSVTIDDGTAKQARSLLLALGLSYRRLETRNIGRFLGRGVRYFGTPSVSKKYVEAQYFVVGGANSAGQAVCHLASNPSAHVTMVVRGNSLEAMSMYLLDRIKALKNVTVLLETEVVEVRGQEQLAEVVLRRKGSSETVVQPTDGLFVFIGAQPKTYWLRDLIALDERGYILTGEQTRSVGVWPLSRAPHACETSFPGVFAAGDVSAGSVKRVSAAVGAGAAAVQMIREYLTAHFTK